MGSVAETVPMGSVAATPKTFRLKSGSMTMIAPSQSSKSRLHLSKIVQSSVLPRQQYMAPVVSYFAVPGQHLSTPLELSSVSPLRHVMA